MALSGTRGVYRSSDRGLTWSPVYSGLPFIEPTEVAFARDVPGRLYLALRGRGRLPLGRQGRLVGAVRAQRPDLRRAGGGAVGLAVTSTAVPAPTLYFRDPALGDWQSATTVPTRPVLDLAIDAGDPLVAYAGVDHPGKGRRVRWDLQDDRRRPHLGARPGSPRRVPTSCPSPPTPRPRAPSSPPRPRGRRLPARANGGVRPGPPWTATPRSASSSNVTVKHHSSSSLLFAATEGYGVQVSTDGGRPSPRLAGLSNLDVNAMAFEPDSDMMYAATSGIFKSTNAGTTWSGDRPDHGRGHGHRHRQRGDGQPNLGDGPGEGVAYSQTPGQGSRSPAGGWPRWS